MKNDIFYIMRKKYNTEKSSITPANAIIDLINERIYVLALLL